MSTARRHLWEYEHPYYGADGHQVQCDSFAELRRTLDRLDEDMNLIYRFDWEDDAQPHRDGLFLDDDDRSGQRLLVFTLQPRRSACASYICPIRHDQEHEVLALLRGPRAAGHLRTLWAPILGEPGAAPPLPGPERPVQLAVDLDAEVLRQAVDSAVRTAVEEHRQRWYAQGWHNARADQHHSNTEEEH